MVTVATIVFCSVGGHKLVIISNLHHIGLWENNSRHTRKKCNTVSAYGFYWWAQWSAYQKNCAGAFNKWKQTCLQTVLSV